MCNSIANGREFSIEWWKGTLENELRVGTILMVEAPSAENQFGKFRYNTNHPYNIHGWPEGGRNWSEDVKDGLDPGHAG